MDGNTREIGSVGAVPDTIPVAALAHEVMKRLPHVMLTGDGARRFATEIGFPLDDVLLDDSKRVWWERLEKELSPEELASFPDIPLAPLQPDHHRSRARARHHRVHLAPTPRAASTPPPRPPAGPGNIPAGSATARSPAPASMPTAATARPPAPTPAR